MTNDGEKLAILLGRYMSSLMPSWPRGTARLRQQQIARDVGDLARDNKEEPDFRIDDVSDAARNPFGFCFNFLVLLINEVWDELGAWCERCPCHEVIQEAHKGYIPVKVARSAFGTDDKGSHCPWRGCRSINLAAGEHEHKLTALWESAFQKLSLTCRHRLTRKQWSDLLLVWHRARGHTTFIATLKLVN